MAKIEDAGELIPYAKKHTSRKPSATAGSKGKSNRLAQLWPEPDWKALAKQSRYDPHTLAALAVGYWGLGTAPIDSDCFNVARAEWPALYDGAVQIVRQVFEGAYDESLSLLRARAKELAGINSLSSQRERMRLLACGRFGGRRLKIPFNPTPKLGWLVGSMADLGWPEDDSCLKMSVGVIAIRTDAKPMDPVWRVITTSPRPLYLQEYPAQTRREALGSAKVEIQRRLEDQGKARALRRAVTRRAPLGEQEREGPDYLGGWDISTEELLATFRLRGVQFGESLSDKEKQRWMNEAFAALHDLARVIGFEPAWLGLGGGGQKALALAIGARGHGQASAHFEPGLRVINLTRDNGAGGICHEFAHALDHHLAVKTFRDGFAYPVKEQTFFTEKFSWVDKQLIGRKAAYARFLDLTNELFATHGNTFLFQAQGIEELKGSRKLYWSTHSEMWARSFEAFVQDRLQASGESSPWLVHGTLPAEQHEPELSPYPLGTQRAELNGLWAAFLPALGARTEASPPAAPSSCQK